MSNSGTKTIFAVTTGFFIGALAGAACGILFAPAKGADTRRKISEKTGEYKDDLSEKLDHLKTTIEDKIAGVMPKEVKEAKTAKK